MASLSGMKVAIMVADGFEQDELLQPRKALDEAGAQTILVSPKNESVRGWDSTDWGRSAKVDQRLNELSRMCANSKLSQQRGSPHRPLPSFVPTTKPYRVLPGVGCAGISSCNRCSCSNP